nr:actin cytoskeleton-regulatory complex protein pan-1-like [Aegilops tauschii subsp. strangulata]
MPLAAASGPSAAPSSAPGARVPAPQAGRLSGFKLSKRRVDYTAVVQPTPAARKRKEEAVLLLGTSLPAPAASSSVEKGSIGAQEKQAAAQAAAAREVVLKDAEVAQDRCRGLEAELKTLRDKRAEEARGREAEEEKMKAREDAIKGRDAELEQSAKAQAAERGRLEELEQKVKAEKAELDAKAKVLSEDHAAFALLEESHLHLRDLAAHLDELLEPVDDEHCVAAAAAMKGQVEALLKKFHAFAPAPLTRSATNPAAPAGGTGGGDAIKEGAPLAGASSVQG